MKGQQQSRLTFIAANRRIWRQESGVPFLAQGSIDASSGALSLLMALMVLGLASRDRVQSLGYGADRWLDAAWRRTLEWYFTGGGPDDVEEVLGLIEGPIAWQSYRGSTRACIAFAATQVGSGIPVLLCLGRREALPGQWCVGVGTEHDASRAAARSLLCLDPSQSPPGLAPFNSRLSLDSPRRGAAELHYAVPGRILTRPCHCAIAIARRVEAWR